MATMASPSPISGIKRTYSEVDREDSMEPADPPEQSEASTAPAMTRRELPADSEYLAARKKARLAGNQDHGVSAPKNFVHHALLSKDISKGYRKALRSLSEATPTRAQVERLQEASLTGPNYLGRTASLQNGFKFKNHSRRTNGHTTKDILMPAADIHQDHTLHDSMLSMSQGELIYMIGRHLIWQDMHGDEFLSYSIDPLFLVHHALNRHSQNQGGTTIQFLDRRRVKDVKGEPAKFYHALDIYDIFKVPKWEGWGKFIEGKLYPRKFTQEYLSHGTLLIKDDRFVQASVEDLIRDGLYDLFPTFKVPDDCIRAGLYSGQVKMRTIGYPPGNVKNRNVPRIYAYNKCAKSTAFTTKLLELVQKLTRNFVNIAKGKEREKIQPHLHIFLCFLTFEKRPRKDEVFMGWIKSHYTASDVLDLYTDSSANVLPGFTRVANNLPGVMQYLDLVRDAAFAFDLPALPANEMELENKLTGDLYAGDDAFFDRENVLFWPCDEGEQTRIRELKKKRRAERKEFLEAVFGKGKKVGRAANAATSEEASTKQGPAKDKLPAVEDAEGESSEGSEEEEWEQDSAAAGDDEALVDTETPAGLSEDEQMVLAVAESLEASEGEEESAAGQEVGAIIAAADVVRASPNPRPPMRGEGDDGEREDTPMEEAVGSGRKVQGRDGGEGVIEKLVWPDDVF